MQLLEVSIGLKAVVASISYYHVAIRGQCQALWAIQWLCRCVDIGQEGTRAVEYLGKTWRMKAEVKSGREESVWGKTEARRKPRSQATPGLTHLYAAVAPVGHDDVPIGVHSYSRGGIELSIALAMRAKFEEELSISTVHLVGEGARD